MIEQMSEKEAKETKAISIRDLTIDDKKRIRQLLQYGDVGKIAVMPFLPSYQQVINVLSEKHSTDNPEVWRAALEYLNSLPEVEIDARLARYIKGVAA